MGQCELQAHSVTANRGGGGGNLISDTKMYTAAAVAAVAEQRGWARNTAAGNTRAVNNASPHPPMRRAAPSTMTSFLLHYEQGITQSDDSALVFLLFYRAGRLA